MTNRVKSLLTLSLVVMTSGAALALAAQPELQLRQSLLPPNSGELGPADAEAGIILQLEARFDCGVENAGARLFVSVGETAVTAEAAESPQAVTLQVPEAQLRGVRESLACPGIGPYLMRDQLTAYATVLCKTPDGPERAVTVTRPISLWVQCEDRSTERAERARQELLDDADTEEQP